MVTSAPKTMLVWKKPVRVELQKYVTTTIPAPLTAVMLTLDAYSALSLLNAMMVMRAPRMTYAQMEPAEEMRSFAMMEIHAQPIRAIRTQDVPPSLRQEIATMEMHAQRKILALQMGALALQLTPLPVMMAIHAQPTVVTPRQAAVQ